MNRCKHGFTFIELLFVVIIIAVLAAMSVPNFLEAQVRAKINRTKTDMAAVGYALGKYYADHGEYPPMHPEAQLFLERYGFTTDTLALDTPPPVDAQSTETEAAEMDSDFDPIMMDPLMMSSLPTKPETTVVTPRNAYFSWTGDDDQKSTRTGNLYKMPGYDYFATKILETSSSKHVSDNRDLEPEFPPEFTNDYLNSDFPVISLSGLALRALTTPVAYLNSLPQDVFSYQKDLPYRYINYTAPKRGKTASQDAGTTLPQRVVMVFSQGTSGDIKSKSGLPDFRSYDPTNGTASSGVISEVLLRY